MKRIKINAKIITITFLLLLSPLVILNSINLNVHEQDIIDNTENYLQTIAFAKRSHINDILDNAREHINLVSSRTFLRRSLFNYYTNNSDDIIKNINSIIIDAKQSTSSFISISIININGSIISSTDDTISGDVSEKKYFIEGLNHTEIHDIYLWNNHPVMITSSPLIFNNVTIGVVMAVNSMTDIMSITNDYRGLGNTGEVVLAKWTDNLDAVVLNELRFLANSSLRKILPKENTDLPLIKALNGDEGFYEFAVDYRGKEVLVFVLNIVSVNWGLLVKIDREEAILPINEQRITTFILSIVLIVIISLSYIMINRFMVKPLSKLTEMANEISMGNLEASTEIRSINEIEILANTLNDMAHALLEANIELEMSSKALQLSEEKLRQATKMEAIGRLSGGVAHNFNNILTAIIGYTELLRLSITNKEDLEYLKEIYRASIKAKDVTSKLLLLSKKQQLKKEVFDVNENIYELLQLLNKLIGDNIDLITKFNNKKCYVYTEKNQFEQIIMNLVINSSQAMTGGKIVIETKIVEEIVNHDKDIIYGNFVEIKVIDNGTGISDKIIDKVFDPFFTTRKDGTGLGLSVILGIVKQNNGYIRVESTEGEGCTMIVSLPVSEISPEDKEKLVTDEIVEIADRSINIVVVDDDKSILNLIKTILINNDFSPYVTDDIEYVKKLDEKIDLLITDISMPDISGIELSKILIEQNSEMKTLFISGFSQKDLKLDDRSDFLAKPFSISQLLTKINKMF